MLNRVTTAPEVGSWSARRWFAHGERLLWADVSVTCLFQAVAAYYVAAFEAALRHDYESWWWAQAAAAQTEFDGRCGRSASWL